MSPVCSLGVLSVAGPSFQPSTPTLEQDRSSTIGDSSYTGSKHHAHSAGVPTPTPTHRSTPTLTGVLEDQDLRHATTTMDLSHNNAAVHSEDGTEGRHGIDDPISLLELKAPDFDWVDLSIIDERIIKQSAVKIRDINVAEASCKFFKEILLQDFPAEVFLQRSARAFFSFACLVVLASDVPGMLPYLVSTWAWPHTGFTLVHPIFPTPLGVAQAKYCAEPYSVHGPSRNDNHVRVHMTCACSNSPGDGGCVLLVHRLLRWHTLRYRV